MIKVTVEQTITGEVSPGLCQAPGKKARGSGARGRRGGSEKGVALGCEGLFEGKNHHGFLALRWRRRVLH